MATFGDRLQTFDPYKYASRLWDAGANLFKKDQALRFERPQTTQRYGTVSGNNINWRSTPGTMDIAAGMTIAPMSTGDIASAGIRTPMGGNILGTTRPAPPPTQIQNSQSMADRILNDRTSQALLQNTRDSAERDRLISERRGRIQSAWAPVGRSIDERMSMLPGERTAMEGQLNNLAQGQESSIRSQQESAVGGLGLQREQRAQEAKKGFRALEEDVRSQLNAYGQKLGVMGASDSSAAGQVAGAIGKQALRGRGDIMDARTQAFQEIDFKISDVKSKADEMVNQVKTSVQNQMFEIGKFFSDRISQLNEAKANASSQEQYAINNMIDDLENQFLERAQGLDDEVRNYKNSISQWQMERVAALEDYSAQLGQAAQFDPSRYAGANNNALAGFNAALTGGGTIQPLNTAQANNLYGYIAPSNTEEDPLKKILAQTPGLQVLN
jgi:hypothetical protein